MRCLFFLLIFSSLLSCSDLETLEDDTKHLQKTKSHRVGLWMCKGRLIRISGLDEITVDEKEDQISLSAKGGNCEVTYKVKKTSKGSYSSKISCEKKCPIKIHIQPDYLLFLAYKNIKENQELTLDCSETHFIDFRKVEEEGDKYRLFFTTPVQFNYEYDDLECYVQI